MVLVVDDEPIVRMALSDHLKDCGYHSVEASNADDAIAILMTGTEIDVVFTDVQMPGEFDGFGLAKWVREHRPELSVFVGLATPVNWIWPEIYVLGSNTLRSHTIWT